MMKFKVAVVAAVMAAGAVWSVQAGPGCCPASKAKAEAAKPAQGCRAALSGLKLTDEQQTKVNALLAECDKGGCSETTCAKMMEGMKGVLSEEQFNSFKSNCDKGAKSGCPMMQKASESNKS
jgi:hypothetical protein